MRQAPKSLLSTICLGAVLSGCASEYPLGNTADGFEHTDAQKVIESAFTKPMAVLREEASSGSYKDELSYKFALSLGRASDAPKIDISNLIPLEESHNPIQLERIDIFADASLEKKRMLINWGDRLVGYLRTCDFTCDVSGPKQTAYPFDTRANKYDTYKNYVTSYATSCVAAISSDYKGRYMINYLSKEKNSLDPKRKSLASFVLHNLTTDDVFWRFNGGYKQDCHFNKPDSYGQYLALYGNLRPELGRSIESYLDQQLTDATNNPNF